MVKIETQLELICPDSPKSKLSKALKSNLKLHHICYETSDINKDLQNLRENNFFIICEPVSATAFNNKKIAWVVDANKTIFELVEA